MPGRRVSRDHSARGGRAADMDLYEEQEMAPEEEPEGADDGEAPSRLPAGAVARAAIRAVAELVGRQPNGVTALEPTEDGWRVAVEVLEDERVPSSADILAIYEAELDMEGNLVAYRRTRRYQRGRADASGG
jgi:Gas vesicle synthesis protein GvpO